METEDPDQLEAAEHDPRTDRRFVQPGEPHIARGKQDHTDRPAPERQKWTQPEDQQREKAHMGPADRQNVDRAAAQKILFRFRRKVMADPEKDPGCQRFRLLRFHAVRHPRQRPAPQIVEKAGNAAAPAHMNRFHILIPAEQKSDLFPGEIFFVVERPRQKGRIRFKKKAVHQQSVAIPGRFFKPGQPDGERLFRFDPIFLTGKTVLPDLCPDHLCGRSGGISGTVRDLYLKFPVRPTIDQVILQTRSRFRLKEERKKHRRKCRRNTAQNRPDRQEQERDQQNNHTRKPRSESGTENEQEQRDHGCQRGDRRITGHGIGCPQTQGMKKAAEVTQDRCRFFPVHRQ